MILFCFGFGVSWVVLFVDVFVFVFCGLFVVVECGLGGF